ncbi:MAG: response regulator [Actinobacteria bacterium]|nr:MAG: response regulator [Actinomycetota bacterium]
MLKVLIVEDDRNVAALVRHLLEEEGFVSSFSVDIEGAWGSLSGEPPDAAIIDLGLLGGESGWDLIERMRKDQKFSNLPVVILTASPPDEVIDRARALNCEYLGKPFSAPALLDRLQLAVRAAGRAPGQRTEHVVLMLGEYRVEGRRVGGRCARPARVPPGHQREALLGRRADARERGVHPGPQGRRSSCLHRRSLTRARSLTAPRSGARG